MKFKIDIEMTPDELRQTLGLPDVSSLHDELIEQIRQRMHAGVEGYDPITLFKPFLNTSLGSMEGFQKMMLGLMNQYTRPSSRSESGE
ncbi:DUF6489 family protein [Nitrincola tapanii]|jgi:hypothetical protein|uniref:Uncharacterized protein n=1 Tax=Nitrincola tapanii TaxID=1708751 RepID=A0A5A9W6L4_9GAMM|nr:DUF6489 family protein [Nitrincola tapanii]KAA0875845.1 hypothetical protein E1H14_03940 [Nitrincola tapanii]